MYLHSLSIHIFFLIALKNGGGSNKMRNNLVFKKDIRLRILIKVNAILLVRFKSLL